MPTVMRMIAVHHANKSGRGQAACFVTLDSAREMVEAGLALWNKKATFINLRKTEASVTPTAASLKMGADIMHLNACGDVRAMALVAGWRPYLKAA